MSEIKPTAPSDAEVLLVRSQLATSVSKLNIARLFLAPIIDTIVSRATSYSSEEFNAIVEGQQSICTIPYDQFQQVCRASSIVSEVSEELHLDNKDNFFPIQNIVINLIEAAQSERVNVDKDLMKQLVELHEMITDTIQKLKDGSYSVNKLSECSTMPKEETYSIYGVPVIHKNSPKGSSLLLHDFEKQFVILDDQPVEGGSSNFMYEVNFDQTKQSNDSKVVNRKSLIEDKAETPNLRDDKEAERKELVENEVDKLEEKTKPTPEKKIHKEKHKNNRKCCKKIKPPAKQRQDVMHEPLNEFIGDAGVLKERYELQAQEALMPAKENVDEPVVARKPYVAKNLYSPSAKLPYKAAHGPKSRLSFKEKFCLRLRRKAAKDADDETEGDSSAPDDDAAPDEPPVPTDDVRAELANLRQMYNELASVVDLLKHGKSTTPSQEIVAKKEAGGTVNMEEAMRTQIEILQFLKELDQIKELLRKLDNPELTIDMSVAGKTPCCELGDYPHIHALLNGVKVAIKLNQTTIDVLLADREATSDCHAAIETKKACACKIQTKPSRVAVSDKVVSVHFTDSSWLQRKSQIYTASTSMFPPQTLVQPTKVLRAGITIKDKSEETQEEVREIDSTSSLPYFVAKKSLPNMNICKPMRVSIAALKMNMRREPLKNPPDHIRRQLKAIGIDNLVQASIPAACCRPAVIDEIEMEDEPYHVSLNSLPLTASDIQVIGQVISEDVPRSTSLLRHHTFQYHPTFQETLGFCCNRVYEVRFFEIFRTRESRQKVKVADALRRFIYGAWNGGSGGSEGGGVSGGGEDGGCRNNGRHKRNQTGAKAEKSRKRHEKNKMFQKKSRHDAKREKKKRKKSLKKKLVNQTQPPVSATEVCNAVIPICEEPVKPKTKNSSKKKKHDNDGGNELKNSASKVLPTTRTITQVSANIRQRDARISEWIDTITESEVNVKEKTIRKKSRRQTIEEIIPMETTVTSAFPKISTTVYTCETKGTNWLNTIHETEEEKKSKDIINKKYECFCEFLRSPEITASFQRFITSDAAMRLFDRGGMGADQFWKVYFDAKQTKGTPNNSTESILPHVEVTASTQQKVGRRKKSKSRIPRPRVHGSPNSSSEDEKKTVKSKKRAHKAGKAGVCDFCKPLEKDQQAAEDEVSNIVPPPIPPAMPPPVLSKTRPQSAAKSSIPSLTYLASQSGPGYISVLHPICGCPEVSIFIPCYCDDSRSCMKGDKLTQIGVEQLKEGSHGQHVILRKNCRIGKVASSLRSDQSLKK